MKHLNIFTGIIAAAGVLCAQTATETATIGEALTTIQSKAASASALLTGSKPADWQAQFAATMDAVIAAANLAKQTVSQIQVPPPPGTGRTISVPAGASVQAAINSAVPGDTIVLQAGSVYNGAIVLPVKSGTGFVTITSSAVASLPEGKRVKPSQASLMARIVGPNGTAVTMAAGAHHYRFIGVEITGATGNYISADIVQIGSGGETQVADLPTDIEFDRVWIHGDAANGAKRGISLNGVRIAVSNSYISDIKGKWQETQALCAWNTPGPLQIRNNHIEGAGMGLLVGGAEPSLRVTPSDIEVTGNHFFKPATWRAEGYLTKFLLELKTGKRVTITGNLFEQTWNDAINIKSGTENVATPAVTSDILVANNIIRRVARGAVLSGRNPVGGSVSNVTVRNNLFSEITSDWGGGYSVMAILDAIAGLTVENNTVAPSPFITPVLLDSSFGPMPSLAFRNNILPHGWYGFFGSGVGEGTNALTNYFPGGTLTNNVFYGSGDTALVSRYPVPNYFPVTEAEIGWTNAGAGDYRLLSTSTYFSTGTDGKSPGVDMAALTAATAKAERGE
jgi:Right handed beta helix region